ncbi:MAG TPA: hypothetical protein DC049_03260 [Spirochaetia bacterium]|nr:hypothetical protein [Spirochaetia bacterium]
MKTKNTDLLLHFNPREIIDAMPGLVCIFKPDGTLVFVNREYEKHFRMTAGHFIGKNLFRFIPKKDCAFVKKNIASLNQKNPTATYQHRVIG